MRVPTRHTVRAETSRDDGRASRIPEEADPHEAEIRRVALGGWRVTDRLVDAGSPVHLLGYVEQRDDGYEVMLIGAEFSWTTVASMAEAIHHLLTVGREHARLRPVDGSSWLIGPPDDSFGMI